jgi:hypothetical protein
MAKKGPLLLAFVCVLGTAPSLAHACDSLKAEKDRLEAEMGASEERLNEANKYLAVNQDSKWAEEQFDRANKEFDQTRDRYVEAERSCKNCLQKAKDEATKPPEATQTPAPTDAPKIPGTINIPYRDHQGRERVLTWPIDKPVPESIRPHVIDWPSVEKLIKTMQQRGGRFVWKQVGVGDCSGQDIACSAGANPNQPECNAERVGLTSVCWTGGRNKGYPPFPGCHGSPLDWCTYKSVSPGACKGGGAPGEMWVCAQEE